MALIIASGMSLLALSHEYRQGALLVFHPWSLPTAEGVQEAPVFLWIDNEGDVDDSLLGASTPAAAGVELLEARYVGAERIVQAVTLAHVTAHATTELSRDGVFLKLTGLKSPLVVGMRIPLTLHFERAGAVQVQIGVQASPEPPRTPAKAPAHVAPGSAEPHHH